jgi:glycosyltransferase involved in cell wall biosynthesis
MKVLYLTPGLGGGGGAERSLASLAPHLQPDIELHVVLFSNRVRLAPQIESAGITLTNLGPGSIPAVARRLRSTIHDFRPDLIHSVLFDADVAARLAAPRSIALSSSLVNVNYGPDQRVAPRQSGWKVAAAQVVDAGTAQRVARFHALSTEVADVMARRLHIDRSKIDVIPRGRTREDVGYYSVDRRQDVRERLGVGQRPLLMAAARHEWQKGLDVLLRAVPEIRASVPDLAVLIGGPPGHETENLHTLARSAGLDPSTTFIGPRDDVPDLMCAADAFCVPSRWEGLGSILVEGMALGARVIAADIPAVRDLDPSGQWLRYFTPGADGELARAAIKVLQQSQAEDPRSIYAVDRFEQHYTSERIGAHMSSFFHRAASS